MWGLLCILTKFIDECCGVFIVLINCIIFVSILTYINIPFFEAFDQNGTKHKAYEWNHGLGHRALKVSKYSILTFPTIHAYGMKFNIVETQPKD